MNSNLMIAKLTLMKIFLLATMSLLLSLKGSAQTNRSVKPNVLFISVDDLNDWINPAAFGGMPGLKTPNFDRLAKMSMSFTNAHVPSPACAPSRAAIMTGVHPAKSGITGWKHPEWRKVPALKDVQTIEQFFKDKGYTTLAGGKIYHTLAPPRATVNQSEAKGWDYYYPSLAIPIPFQVRAPLSVIDPKLFVGKQPDYFSWGPIAMGDEYMADYQIVDWANYQLAQKYDKPLFLAVGLTKPHDPWEVPQKYFDMYPLESVPDVKIKQNDLEDAFVHGRRPLHKFILDNNQQKKVVQAYMATISFTDAMLGRLLDAFEKSAYKNNTIIVLWSDHGMHMGEKENWEKFTLWERSTRAPLFVFAPGVTKGGTSTHKPVGIIDLYPTLAELIGEKAPAYVDGESLVPMLKGQNFNHRGVVTGYELKEGPEATGGDAYTIRTDKYRYIYYPFINLEELYDHQTDDNEWENIAYKGSSKKVIADHRRLLLEQVNHLKWPGGNPKGYSITAEGLVRKTEYLPLESMSGNTKFF
ncbi:sulfatase [Daejeonella lutea]|uniref:Arylsulfatase A n=1 Tax=Daejeonella lutea TaxID=572036 RepID=A0A1T5AAC7_9SPHI|nr:sulfatase [Daejeonella lutea]SKB31855.1 Arylsulfatase A [Daejeonella lutea]